MADLDIDHAGTNECVEDMNQLASQMANSVDELIGQLTRLSQSFSGAAATEFQSIASQRSQINQELNQSFSGGAATLGGMHDTMINGDKKAASIIQ